MRQCVGCERNKEVIKQTLAAEDKVSNYETISRNRLLRIKLFCLKSAGKSKKWFSKRSAVLTRSGFLSLSFRVAN